MKVTAHYLKPYTSRAVIYGLCVVTSTVLIMATALSAADFLKLLFDPDNATHIESGNIVKQWLNLLYVWMISYGQHTALWLFSSLLVALFILKNLFGYLSSIIAGDIRNKMQRDIRNDLFEKTMYLPIGYHNRQREGDLLSRFGNDLAEYDENVLSSIQSLVAAAVTITIYLAMLLYMDARLTAMVLFSIPIIGGAISWLSHRLKRSSKSLQEQQGQLLSLSEETIHGLRIIKAFNAIDFTNTRYRGMNREYSRHRTSIYRRISAASPLSEFLGSAIVVAILLYGATLVMNGDTTLSPELFISYLMLFVLLLPPAKSLSTSIAQIRRGKGCESRIEELLSSDGDERGDNAKRQVEKIGEIRFSDVHMDYNATTPSDSQRTALHGIDFTIQQGMTLAIVGKSGSGKSTIANLLLRFYEPTGGCITMDGTDIQEFSIASWRARIGVVAQEPQLFNDTIANNIAYGRPEASSEEIENAARIADAHGFIAALPDGYNTRVGDGGSMLSGGQRQRICIARAIVRNPDLLIFDEATSALDSESEQTVQRSIDKLLKNHTTIIIAHRLSTIRNADCIVVLDNGKIAESGTHGQLINKKGIYYHLVHDAQADNSQT